MGRAALCMRAAALLAAAGMFIFLAEGISADNDIAEAVAARVLEPTELVAEIPEEFGTLFQIQWGGGSLFQLASRLAALGCAMNTLWVHDSGQWHPYNRYDVPRDAALIQEFIGRYERDLPAGTFYATCSDQPVPQNLQPTQIVADIAEEYNTLFELQWGGGSLLHLKGRLATMGCVANNISFADPATDTRHAYNQYNTRSTDPENHQFVQTFKTYIPAGTIQADCFNVCEFKDRECLSFEEARKQYHSDFSDINGVPCTDDFHPIVKEKVFPILPIRPDTCIIRAQNRFYGGQHIRGFAMIHVTNTSPAVVVLDGNDNYRSWTNEHSDILLYVEIHELCHINQQWQRVQQLSLNKSDNYLLDEMAHYFFNSSYGKEFVKAIGYDIVPPLNSPYRDLYGSFNKKEISAELCALYILDKIEARSIYGYRKYDSFRDYFQQVPIRDFDTSKYLTPEVVEWLETYMILPQIAEDAGDE